MNRISASRLSLGSLDWFRARFPFSLTTLALSLSFSLSSSSLTLALSISLSHPTLRETVFPPCVTMQAIKQIVNGGTTSASSESTSPLKTNGHSHSTITNANGQSNGSLLPSSSSSQVDLASDLLDEHTGGVELSGHGLTIAKVVAAARKGQEVRLGQAPEIRQRIDDSVAFLQSKSVSLGLLIALVPRPLTFPRTWVTWNQTRSIRLWSDDWLRWLGRHEDRGSSRAPKIVSACSLLSPCVLAASFEGFTLIPVLVTVFSSTSCAESSQPRSIRSRSDAASRTLCHLKSYAAAC